MLRPLAVLALLVAAAQAADGPKLLEPKSENGAPVVYRSTRLVVPPGTALRLEVSLAAKGRECFGTSIVNWDKELQGGKRFHTINFDAGLTPADGKRPKGCPKRESGHLGMHTLDLPAEKGDMHVWIVYREGQEVRATYGKSFSTEGFGPGRPAAEPTAHPASR